MKVLVLIALVFICEAFGSQCPSQEDLGCVLYGSVNPACDLKRTVFKVGDEECQGCDMCTYPAPDGGCPIVFCPPIAELMDCGRQVHALQMEVNGQMCMACDVAIYDCRDLSWQG